MYFSRLHKLRLHKILIGAYLSSFHAVPIEMSTELKFSQKKCILSTLMAPVPPFPGLRQVPVLHEDHGDVRVHGGGEGECNTGSGNNISAVRDPMTTKK